MLEYKNGDGILDLVRKAAGEEWIADGEDATPVFLELISKAQSTIRICTSNLRPEFFEQQEILSAFLTRLESGVNIEIVFAKPGVNSTTEARDAVLRENPGIIRLNELFPDRLRLFLAESRPRLQFTVVDGVYVLNTAPDRYDEHPPVIVRLFDKKWGQEWDKGFIDVRDNYTQKAF